MLVAKQMKFLKKIETLLGSLSWLPLCKAEKVCLAFLEDDRGQAHYQALPEPSPVD